ncbi:hypothetical protein EW026_g2856 [Hermanssonia centrifuga]|uniref:Uncharacterized protein n=1 Tax=Hermanssonia centrifuga TaxID=98765 RepID=A0A4S4KNV4_9APHY|nr:hypothetical protein EW026_g2856 [Hermanssonia centrifuga]
MANDVAKAQLIDQFMTAVVYGIYLVTLGMTISVLFWGRMGQKRRNWPLIFVMALMFIFATFDVAFGLQHNLDAFIYYTGPVPRVNSITAYANANSSADFQTVDVQIMALIGDAMLIYRCLVVFNYKWLVIIFPVLLWLANAVCAVAIIIITATLHQTALIHIGNLKPWITAFLVVTLLTNLITTGLIVWRIWSIDKESTRMTSLSTLKGGSSKLARVIRIVVESALLYTTLVLMTTVADVIGSNAIYPLAETMVVVIGISFNLIIIRVDKGIAVGPGTYVETSPSIPLNLRRGPTHHTTTYGMEVEVDVAVLRDSGDMGRVHGDQCTSDTTKGSITEDATKYEV